MKSGFRILASIVVLFAAVAALAPAVGTPKSASAAPTFWLPWQKGTVWYVRCGNFDCEHGGSSANYYGFDANYISGRGTDLVTAVADGKVIGVQNSIPDSTIFNGGHAGNCVIMDHGGGYFSLYAHLAQGSVPVTVGQTISHGTVIGQMGNSGYSTGKHLHWSVGSSAWMYSGYGYQTCSMTTRESRYADPDAELIQDGGLPRAGRYYESFNTVTTPADPRQEGAITLTGGTTVGSQATFTITIKNYGGTATNIFPYIEGSQPTGVKWASSCASPCNRVIQPGATQTFTVWQVADKSGTWTISGFYLWDSAASQYWKPLPQNGGTRPTGFTAAAPPTATFTPTKTPTATATKTPTLVPTVTASNTPTPTATQVASRSITLSKTKSKYNGKVQAVMTGFAPNSTVTVRWQDGTTLATTTSDSRGAAAAWFRTPLVAYGTYRVEAMDTLGGKASTKLSVIPRIMLAPEDTGPVGYRFRVYFYGFSAGEQVQIQWYDTSGTSYQVLKTVSIADNGRGTTLVNVPTGTALGNHMIRGKVVGVSRSASTYFTVTAGAAAAEEPTATPEPTSTVMPEPTATVTPEPAITVTPEPSSTPVPTESPVPTEQPSETPVPDASPDPIEVPAA